MAVTNMPKWLDASSLQGLLTLLVLMSLHILTRAQNVDTLQMAALLNSEKQFAEATALLETYQADHGDFISLRMLAETHYWEGGWEEAEMAYREALGRFPEQFRCHLELARVLFAQNRLHDAREQLVSFLTYEPHHAEAHYLLGVTYYWRGNFSRAREHISIALRENPDFSEAQQVWQDLRLATAPDVHLGLRAATDDQPLTSLAAETGLKMYRSTLFAPEIGAALSHFNASADVMISRLRLANTFTWWKPGLRLTLGGQAVIVRDRGTEQGWEMQLQKGFRNGYALTLSADYQPYTWTLRSLENVPLIHSYKCTLARSETDRFQLEIAYWYQVYTSELQLHTGYAWGLSPPLRLESLSLRGGYSFSYADATDNLFVAVKTVDEILHGFPDLEIEGVFDPYYTPMDNTVHAILGNVALEAGQFSLGLTASVGLDARTQHPYLYLDLQNDEVIIARGFYQETYKPVTLDGRLTWKPSGTITISASYRYLNSLFYTRHNAGLTISKKLIGDER